VPRLRPSSGIGHLQRTAVMSDREGSSFTILIAVKHIL
jgi:hypothetical protein